MNPLVLALFVGLLAGFAGAFMGHWIADPPAAPMGAPAADGDLAARLARIERLLEERPEAPLEGRPARAPAPTTVKVELDDALLAALDERVRSAVRDSVTETIRAAEDGSVEVREPPKRKVTLAEAAAELRLTAQEEESVRRITKETTDKMLGLLVGEDETVEDLRREFELAKDDPAKRGALMGRVVTKALGNLGGFIGISLEHQTKMQNALGAEKAARLEREFEITDLDPYGIGGVFDGMGD